MKKQSLLVFIYGIFILIGGIIGHVKAASKASLISGTVFGALLMLSSYAMYKEKKFGFNIAVALTFFLDAFFTLRFTQTHAFFPAGFLSLLSLAVIVFLLLNKKQKRTV